jgi:SAM-dependent methyltransferase
VSVVVWHDVECGSYAEDLPLWRALAADPARPDGAVLDVGAGTGRVALELARHGHDVVAVDRDERLLAALRERAGAGGLTVRTVCADARALALEGQQFGLIVVPMQTIQLLGGAEARAAFLRAARAHLAPGGLLACAIADALEAFDELHDEPPLPDLGEVAGVLYASRPVALRDEGTRVAIERIRETVDGDGARTADGDVVHLDRLDAAMLGREGAAAGLRPEPPRPVAQTAEHVGSTVVMLRG